MASKPEGKKTSKAVSSVTPPPIRDFIMATSPEDQCLQSLTFYLGLQAMIELQPNYKRVLETQAARRANATTGSSITQVNPVEREQQEVATALLDAQQYVMTHMSLVIQQAVQSAPPGGKKILAAIIKATNFEVVDVPPAELRPDIKCEWTSAVATRPAYVKLTVMTDKKSDSDMDTKDDGESGQRFIVSRAIANRLQHFYFFSHFPTYAVQIIRQELHKPELQKFYSRLDPRAHLTAFLKEKVLEKLLADHKLAQHKVIQSFHGKKS